MAFNDLLRQLGGIGRFQKAQVTLIILPMLLMASHNTLQNFTAAVPPHHCRPPASANLSRDGELEAWLPRDGQGRPESCLRFTSPQRGLPFPNGTEANGTEATEPCTNGWIYDNSTFPSTIVTEWDLVCSHRALRQLAQSLYMVGVLLGAIVFGHLADRLGRRKVLILSHLQMAASGTCTAFAPSFPVYCAFRLLSGMSTSGIIQVIFGAVDLPAKFVGFVAINHLGRRPAQIAALLLAGICILANGVIPQDQSTVRTSLAVLGKGCLAASFSCIFLYTGELYPTMIRQTGLGMGSTMARVGSIASPLVSMTAELFPSMPLFIYGTVPVVASTVAALLPETLGHPLPDTVQDLEDRRRGKPQRQQQEQQKQMVPLQASAQEKNGL
uniref:Solute carrier family 22 member 6 n=1 Tax=Myotis myotis TaxID=51298 RepID=A0A7J7RHC0_MYOMY|nr:solute carrier family 22 member 6 [Myotis myotis]